MEGEMSEKYTSKCPECGKIIEIDDYSLEGDEIVCDHCDTDLEIVKMDPVKLKIVARHFDDEEYDYADLEEPDIDYDSID